MSLPSHVKKTFLAMCLIAAGCGAMAQPKKAPVTAAGTSFNLNDFAARLADKVKDDPKNPLKVDKESLVRIADKLPNGNLKLKMLEYSTRLDNPDLSYRQVYWDMAQAFDVMPEAARMMEFADTYKSVDVLMNKSKLVINAFKGDLSGINATTFVNDPTFMNAMSKVTGSTDVAQNIGSAMGIGVEIIKAFKADRERKKKFIEDYKRFSELSTAMLYTEMDERLSRSLIDASVSKLAGPVNAIFRYDFQSGASLFVEGGILKWRNGSGTVTKNVCLAQLRNNGVLDFDYKSRTVYGPTSIMVLEDSAFIMPQYNDSRKCAECLLQPDTKKFMGGLMGKMVMGEPRWIDMRTGELKPKMELPTKPKEVKKYMEANQKLLEDMKVELPAGGHFQINGKQVKAKPEFMMAPQSAGALSVNVFFEADLDKKTDFSTIDYGSILYIRNNTTRKFSNNLLHNKAVAVFSDFFSRSLLVFGANGAIAKISIDEVDPEAAAASIEKQLNGRPVLPPTPLSLVKEQVAYEGVGQNASGYQTLMPKVMLTPDNKTILYAIGDQLCFINPKDINQVPTFSLTFKPESIYFGKENGEQTIYLAGFNEFTFPISKKYSLKKLLEPAKGTTPESPATLKDAGSKMKGKGKAATEPGLSSDAPAKTTPAKKGAKEKAGSGSLADELKKLKDLYDSGALSKEEFDAAKKKLIEQ